MELKFQQKKLVCCRCGLEIPDNQGTKDREWKPGKGRVACENCARKIRLQKSGRSTLSGDQQKLDTPSIKIE